MVKNNQKKNVRTDRTHLIHVESLSIIHNEKSSFDRKFRSGEMPEKWHLLACHAGNSKTKADWRKPSQIPPFSIFIDFSKIGRFGDRVLFSTGKVLRSVARGKSVYKSLIFFRYWAASFFLAILPFSRDSSRQNLQSSESVPDGFRDVRQNGTTLPSLFLPFG